MPLLTREDNVAISAAVLVAAAQAVRETDEPIPERLRDDFVRLADAPRESAQAALDRVFAVQSWEIEATKEWRRALRASDMFRQVAADLSINFLVLTKLTGTFGERRVLKLSYEEQGTVPAMTVRASLRNGWAQRTRMRERRRQFTEWRGRRRHQQDVNRWVRFGGHTRLMVQTRGPRPLADVRVEVSRYGQRRCAATTGKDGCVEFALQQGAYEISAGPVDGGGRPARVTVVLTGNGRKVKRLNFPGTARNRTAADGTLRDLSHTITRSIGWRSRPIIFDAPAVGHCRSFHFEVEVPDQLKLTTARLEATRPVVTAHQDIDALEPDVENVAQQRAHLHLALVPSSWTGEVMIRVRPRASFIVRAGYGSSLVTTLLLAMTWRWYRDLTGVVGSIATLLLFVPGGLSAYVVGSGESPLATSVAFGMRLLAVGVGALALTAASVMIFAREWVVTGRTVVLEPYAGVTGWLLGGTTVLSAIITLIFANTWIQTRRLKEQRD
ncbi:hypothetical protein [Baekduia sp.]|uniref:hypothetical protein n=1 Tax=Baekduia sp. TaxID=2600305 RepID=UPI002E1688F3